eukprot:10397215-Alexandrium_andersonii.AAC.1
MSASLVGSEMCIRDRQTEALEKKKDAAHGRANAASFQLIQARRVGRAAPVSYTHLTLPTICSV